MRTLPSFALAAGVALASLAAAPRPARAQGAQASDVVMLRNGGLLRGTISEYVPGSHVVLVTVAGETKRVGAAELKYAGPAAGAPGAAGPATSQGGGRGGRGTVTVNAPEVPVRLQANHDEVTFHLRTGESTGSAVTTGFGMGFGYRGGAGAMPSMAITNMHGRSYGRVCTAPCEATAPAGTYSMALSKGNNGTPVETEEMVRIDGPSTLQGTYTSYATLRGVGVAVVVASLIGGGYLIYTSFDSEEVCQGGLCADETKVDKTQLIGGSALLIGGTILGSVLSGKSDEASIRVVPAASGALPGRAQTAWASDRARPASGPLPGLSVAVTF